MKNIKSPMAPFEGKVRVRVCGVLKHQEGILLLKHVGIGSEGFLWSPPGGGVEFGDTLEQTLKREFLEETGLTISIDDFLTVYEHIDTHLHAIEFFYEVSVLEGHPILGIDPELPDEGQILTELGFFSNERLNQMPAGTIHHLFKNGYQKETFNTAGL